jgi:uridine phosphorylase
VPDIDRILAELQFSNGLRIENMEMESSFLFHFGAGMGYAAASVCPTVANRAANSFARDSRRAIEQAAAVALQAIQAVG